MEVSRTLHLVSRPIHIPICTYIFYSNFEKYVYCIFYQPGGTKSSKMVVSTAFRHFTFYRNLYVISL